MTVTVYNQSAYALLEANGPEITAQTAYVVRKPVEGVAVAGQTAYIVTRPVTRVDISAQTAYVVTRGEGTGVIVGAQTAYIAFFLAESPTGRPRRHTTVMAN